MTASPAYAVVIPTVGRPCLARCLAALADSVGPGPREVVVVDDRPDTRPPLDLAALGQLQDVARLLHSGGRGPAAARNTGWRAVSAPWVVFLDDDVRVTPAWRTKLEADLGGAPSNVGGVQGLLEVPLPADRRPTDWERNTAGLGGAWWATADMAYRTAVLSAVGGFDERFPRAFREDADLALRAMAAGWVLERGARVTRHPVRPSDPWVSLRQQAGNADDALMVRLHGRNWWQRAGAPRGRLRRHAAVTAAGAAAAVLALARRPGPSAALGLGWALGTAEFAWTRISAGPRTPREVAAMVVTSVAIPPLAVWHRLRGAWHHRGGQPLPASARRGPAS
ncbi:glycosyltransferase family 2 protein [Streptomyces morookaense]|uniref:Glycosyltransferase n=1 Tax=Streptomyces morookaense TaxID=1970 RepID=A0A7Y7E581_STRMO|nr:glycosyltransferase [Streptomyces morookaense]NVK76470.1 glycosyltransferase [Streptomyces morookaense]GHF07333.1 transferase [Streptomyces morookaense]